MAVVPEQVVPVDERVVSRTTVHDVVAPDNHVVAKPAENPVPGEVVAPEPAINGVVSPDQEVVARLPVEASRCPR